LMRCRLRHKNSIFKQTVPAVLRKYLRRERHGEKVDAHIQREIFGDDVRAVAACVNLPQFGFS